MWWRHGNCGHRFWAELPAWDLQGHNGQSNYDSNNNSKLIHHLSKTPNALHLCAYVLVTALMKFWSSIQRSSMHDCYFWDRRHSVTGEAQAHASCSNHVLVHNARNIYFLFLSKANFSKRHVYFCNAQLPSAIKRPLNFIRVLKYTPWVKKKTRHQTLGHNFTNYYPIFKIFSLADSVVNLQQIHV